MAYYARNPRVKMTPEEAKKRKAYLNQIRYSERRDEILAANAAWRRDHPEFYLEHERGRARKRLAEAERLAGRPRPELCEVCSRKPQGKDKVTYFDHDHQTDKFRGWLCSNCNLVLGLVGDDPEILRKLAEYLERR